MRVVRHGWGRRVAIVAPPVVSGPAGGSSDTAPRFQRRCRIDQHSIRGEPRKEIGERLGLGGGRMKVGVFLCARYGGGAKEIDRGEIATDNSGFVALELDLPRRSVSNLDRGASDCGTPMRDHPVSFGHGCPTTCRLVRMELNSDRLEEAATRWQGKLSGLTKRNTVLYLVDNDGFVYQIDQVFLKSKRRNEGTFQHKSWWHSTTRDNRCPRWVIAMSSERPIRARLLETPRQALPASMPKLLETIPQPTAFSPTTRFFFFFYGGS